MVTNGVTFFREEQKFRQLWIRIFVLLLLVFVWYGAIQQLIFGISFGNNPASDPVMFLLLIVFGILFPAFMLSLKMVTEVRNDGLYIRFYPIHRSFRRFTFESIRSYEVRDYSPLKDYGGWGIRFGPKGQAYNVSGSKGVVLVLEDGKRLMVGSKQPDELAAAISRGMDAS
ncbi:hypothetical protein HWN40_08530 [Methanolobus zinderi]|uniref:Uncharacterized protein n=1 Tax=Methanolobus zinderi TaxID=536044 RepID=A0A7D5I9B8_9EURY|nr:DUF6141 family protein [Methanolobus zinderi]QLC50282.1 hypothetical protein HWN40_08530 [Methanolobus zinderi]